MYASWHGVVSYSKPLGYGVLTFLFWASSKDLVVCQVCNGCRIANANVLNQSYWKNENNAVNQSESETKIGNLTQERGKTRVIASDWSEKQYVFSDWLIHDTLKQTTHSLPCRSTINRNHCILVLSFLYFCSNQWVVSLCVCGYYPLHVTASPVGLK